VWSTDDHRRGRWLAPTYPALPEPAAEDASQTPDRTACENSPRNAVGNRLGPDVHRQTASHADPAGDAGCCGYTPRVVSRRGSRARLARVLPLLLGAIAVAGLLAVDPAALSLLLDVDLLILLGSVGLTMTRGSVRVLLTRLSCTSGARLLGIAVVMTREDPRSLLGTRTAPSLP
jgi:hypothetical protein